MHNFLSFGRIIDNWPDNTAAHQRARLLEAMRVRGGVTTLEAMRCRDLATAWDHKGQPAYAADYRERARLVGG